MNHVKKIPVQAVCVDWAALVDHATAVQADELMERVYRKFQETDEAFMAVLAGEQVVGLCARDEIGMDLGSQYGYSLFSHTPVSEHLVEEPLVIVTGQPWVEVLPRVFARTGESFHQDVILTDAGGRFLGLIGLQSMVRLQTQLLRDTIAELEERQAEINRRSRQMTEDLMMAREMQLAMLPREIPPVAVEAAAGQCAVQLISHYAPLGMVSGDFFEVLAISDSMVGLLIADVMGHGVQAALVTAMMRALIQTHSALAADPGAFLTEVNHSLCQILKDCKVVTFASAFMAVVDLAMGTLRYANAGHPSPIVLRRGARDAVLLPSDGDGNGGILGITAKAGYATNETGLAAGDVVMLFTDGLFEIRGGDGEMLGLNGLLALASRDMKRSAADLIPGLVEEVARFSGEGRFDDDVCLVALEVRELALAGPIAPG